MSLYTQEKKVLTDEQTALIKKSVRKFLSDYKELSKYRINKIVNGELEDPCGWYNPDSEKSPIEIYYSNLKSANVMANFIDHVHARYGIYLRNYV